MTRRLWLVRRGVCVLGFVGVLLAMLPDLAFGQAAITGAVRDTSGAALPGVTVEAASPVLIERVRSTVSGESGLYRIDDLRPGSYTVTFTLTGFSVVKREGIELSGNFVATVNIELRVGAIEETVTVVGESPIVDVTSTTQQRVIQKEVVDTIPSGRIYQNVGILIPGMVETATAGPGGGRQDVGGARGDAFSSMQIHGGRNGDQVFYLNGVSYMSGPLASLGTGPSTPDTGSIQEIIVTYSGGLGDAPTGGVVFNFIPREGGNQFSGSFSGTYANGSMQSSNLDQKLRDMGITALNTIRQLYDVNPSIGGPILKDRLWFFSSYRYLSSSSYSAGIYFNRNASQSVHSADQRLRESVRATPEQLNSWTYEPDLSRQGYRYNNTPSINGRVTLQASERNKFSAFYENQQRDEPYRSVSATTSPEAASYFGYQPERTQVTWTSPMTNRLLLEAGWTKMLTSNGNYRNNDPRLIPVIEQSTGLAYRNSSNNTETFRNDWGVMAALRYVTGTHSVKVGMSQGAATRRNTNVSPNLIYRFNNGIPNQITQNTSPVPQIEKSSAELGIYAQDTWKFGRVTLNGGLRFDYINRFSPEQSLGPSEYVPNRNFTFPRTVANAWKDVTPRMSASIDVFGTGRTALKFTAGKFMIRGYGDYPSANPSTSTATSTTRAWTDSNRNYVVDCDLTNKVAQNLTASGGDICGAMSNQSFGSAVRVAVADPDWSRGWGRRPYNWEFSTSVQHQLAARVSMTAGYYRRVYGNFVTTDNRAATAQDFSTFSIPIPVNVRLPAGGGGTLGNLVNVVPAKFGLVDEYITGSSEYGKQIEHWDGVDLTLDMRLAAGLTLAGGLSNGRTLRDNCEVARKLPELGVTAISYCRQASSLKHGTQVKFLTSYTIPRVDLLVSATFQGIPGAQVAANYNLPSAVAAASLGRPLSGGAANVTVNVVEPGTLHMDWLNQLDLRVGKTIRFGRTRSRASLDVYNALNSNAAQAVNATYGPAWLRPTAVTTARFAKISVQFDF